MEDAAVSSKQIKRLRHQTNTVLLWLRSRRDQMKMALEHFKHKQSDAMRDFYTAHPELSIDAMVKATCKAADICIITFRKWRKQFVLNGKFKRCDSGLAQFGWLLVNNDKKMELTHWLKSQKELSVVAAREWINDCLLSDLPVGRRMSKWGQLQRPISYTTAHRWMLYCGCKYETVTKSYCTEAHERHSTLLYRRWFCDVDYFLSLRMHRWACFSSVTLKQLKDQFKAKWPDDSLGHKIPIHDVGKFPPGAICMWCIQLYMCVNI